MSRELRAYIRLVLQETYHRRIFESDDVTSFSPTAPASITSASPNVPGNVEKPKPQKVKAPAIRLTHNWETDWPIIKKEFQKAIAANEEPYIEYKKYNMSVYERLQNVFIDLAVNHLGQGSSRIVYPAGDDMVIKVAKNDAGSVQNGNEKTISDKKSPMVTEVFEADNNFLWILSEKITPIDKTLGAQLVGVENWNIAEKIIQHIGLFIKMGTAAFTKSGVPWRKGLKQSLRGIKGAMPAPKDLEEIDVEEHQSDIKYSKEGFIKILMMYARDKCTNQKLCEQFIKNMFELMSTADNQLIGDMAKIDSWGVDKNNNIKLLDYGVTNRGRTKDYVGDHAK